MLIEARTCIRISETQHLRWNEIKNQKRLPNDDAVAKYLMDLASGINKMKAAQSKLHPSNTTYVNHDRFLTSG